MEYSLQQVPTASKLGKTIASIVKDANVADLGIVMPTGTGNAGLTQFFLVQNKNIIP